MKKRLKEHWVGILYFLVAGISGGLQIRYKHNNFMIFRHEFYTLMAGGNLYTLHPAFHWQFFRYSPTFALLFAPIAVMSVFWGMVTWSIINAMAVYAAVRILLPRREATVVLLLALIEVNNAIQNTQSNALCAALMILAFVAYENDRPWSGATATIGGTLIKIFPVSAGLFGLLHAPRGRWRVVLAAAVVTAIGVLLPLPVHGAHWLIQEYRWWHADEMVHLATTEWSFMAALNAWFDWPAVWWPVQAAALMVLLAPIAARTDAWRDRGFRQLVLCSLLCFVTLFNHGAESPSYVIAMLGVFVWWVSGPRHSYQNVLMLLCFALSSLTHDFVPPSWRGAWLNPSRARVLPVFVTWLAMQVELLRWRALGAPAGSGDPEVGQLDVAALKPAP